VCTCERWSPFAGEAEVLQRLFELNLVDEFVVVGIEHLREGREAGREGGREGRREGGSG